MAITSLFILAANGKTVLEHGTAIDHEKAVWADAKIPVFHFDDDVTPESRAEILAKLNAGHQAAIEAERAAPETARVVV